MYNCEQEYAGYNQVYPNQLDEIQEEEEAVPPTPPEQSEQDIPSEKETPVKEPVIIKGVSFLKNNTQIVTDINTLKENKLTIIGLCQSPHKSPREDLNTN
jgi:hypothetical protein